MQKKTGTPQFMKSMNRAMIIDALSKNSPVSQTKICEITGLSRATVSTIVNELKQEDLILEVSREISTGGRRQILLKLDENAGCVVGIDLGGTKMVGAVTNLNGKFIAKMCRPTQADEGPNAILESLTNVINALIAKAGVKREKVRGVGIGVPGVVRAGGIVEWAPNLKWRNLDLAAKLTAAIQRPVFIENDVNLLALGEYWYGAAQGVQSMACLAVGTGIGAGLIINGQLYTGVHQAAGEVCNLLVDRSYLAKDFSQFGCLEMLASGPAIARQFTEAMQNSTGNRNKDNVKDNLIGEKTELGESGLTGAEIVFDEAARNHPVAKQIIEEFARNIAMAIIAITTVLDPEVVVLGGGVSQNAGLFRDRILELCTPVVQVMPRIEVSALGIDAGVMGAIALTLHHTREKPW
jgi:glucokinase